MSDTKEPRRFWIVDESDLFESHRDALSEQQFREQRGYSSIIEVIEAAPVDARIRELEADKTELLDQLEADRIIDREPEIKRLQSRVAELEAALERIMDHQASLMTGEVRLSTTYLMAAKALGKE